MNQCKGGQLARWSLIHFASPKSIYRLPWPSADLSDVRPIDPPTETLNEAIGTGAALTKRAVFFLVLFVGIGLAVALAYAGRPPPFPNLKLIAGQMIFYGTISAAIGAARTPGRWNEKIRRREIRARILPRWVWPLLFVFLANANYLVALAIALGDLPFAPRRTRISPGT